ncbi:MAG TPA: hypothetical protein VNW90_10720 [Acetobacteraceae bacterium]|jgi:hypothetical protein|nr:hypothetical protein [Acetobacteraceae bacterium]
MAVLGATSYTLADWAQEQDPDGRTPVIIDLLSQANEILDDMVWLEGNLVTGHRGTVRTSLPSPTPRPMNVGVPNAKATSAVISATCGNFEAYSLIDKDLADLNGNTAGFRLNQDKGFFEGMSQYMAGLLFYGYAPTAPATFTGLAPYYSTVTLANAQTANNVLDMGGVGSTNTSLWLTSWSQDTCHGIFPKGKKAGVQHVDMGEWPVQDASLGWYQAYRSHFKWEAGLFIADWRFQVRAGNIDVTTLSGTQAPNIINALDRMLERPPRLMSSAASTTSVTTPSGTVATGDRSVLYANRIVRTWLRIQVHSKPNLLLNYDNVDGKPILSYCGLPFRTVDQVLSTEARIV